MKKQKNFFTHPPLWLLLVVAFIGVVSVVAATVLMTRKNPSPQVTSWGYVALGIMVVSVGYAIFGAVKTLPELSARALKWSENKPLINRMLTEYGFRTILFSVGSFTINLAFAIYNGVVAIINRSVWFGALASYYILLIALRGGILIYFGKRTRAVKKGQPEKSTYIKDTAIYGVCGIVLVLLPIALSFAVLQMVRANDSFVHAGITIYVYAVYSSYKIIMSVRNFLKVRRTNEMIVRASRNINLADALTSVLALQTAMLREFDMGDIVKVATMNAVTGAVVCGLTAIIGVFMSINAARTIRSEKHKPDC